MRDENLHVPGEIKPSVVGGSIAIWRSMSAACDGVASNWWIDKALELRGNGFVSEPLSRICVVNYQTAEFATAALCQWPNAALSGVRFRRGHAMHLVDEAILSVGAGRTALRNVRGLHFAVGDSRALPYASQCDLLLVDTSAPRWSQLPSENGTESPPSEQPLSRWQRQRRAEFKQSLLAGLGPALEAASRNAGSVVIIHGPQCTAGTARVDRTGVHCTSAEHCYPATDSSFKAVRCWSSLFSELAAAHSLLEAGCRDVALNSTDGSGDVPSATHRTCFARVNAGSLCASRTPPLLAKGGLLRAVRARVRFDSGRPSIDRLLSRSARYFIAVPCGGGGDGGETGVNGRSKRGAGRGSGPPSAWQVCLLFKDAPYENWVGGVASDDGLRFTGVPLLVLPHLLRVTESELRASGQQKGRLRTRLASLTHNVAVLAEPDGSFLLVGGKYHVHRPVGNGNTGIWMIQARRNVSGLTKSAATTAGAASTAARLPLLSAWSGTPVGLLHDALLAANNGTSSLHEITKGGRLWSLKRAQPSLLESRHLVMKPRLLITGHQKGCVERRSAEIAHWIIGRACEYDGRLSVARHPTDGRLLLYSRANLASHGQRFVQLTSSDDGGETWSRFRLVKLDGFEPSSADVYFFSVHRNPAHNQSLLAVYPLVQHFQGCLCLSVSLDGRRWSKPDPLARCGVAGERATSQNAAGFIERGGVVDLYVHEGVPGIQVDASTPLSLHKFWSRHERESRLSRFTVPLAALRLWTEEALKGLLASEPDASRRPTAR